MNIYRLKLQKKLKICWLTGTLILECWLKSVTKQLQIIGLRFLIFFFTEHINTQWNFRGTRKLWWRKSSSVRLLNRLLSTLLYYIISLIISAAFCIAIVFLLEGYFSSLKVLHLYKDMTLFPLFILWIVYKH